MRLPRRRSASEVDVRRPPATSASASSARRPASSRARASTRPGQRGRQGGRRRRRDHLPLLQEQGRPPDLALRGPDGSSSRPSGSARSSERRRASASRRIIELQLGLLEGERDLAEVITVNLRQSTRLMKQYAAPKFNLTSTRSRGSSPKGNARRAPRRRRPRIAARSSARSTASRSPGRSPTASP